ncbi:alpha-L-rhamnosidase [Cohnella silvisoli]|uniref:alpha-L-rhamnosidase n=1 Tax=Cohnella silvisoli TaxID=2873699 RepID=A0ABV1KRT9_9BACL|nr:alpha-L-rhamnosidase [Cohnella silvisoli]MCD9022438.1 glycoside hydrolase family 78 protein [Cohnella silvisoli]
MSSLKVESLVCEYRTNPLGIDVRNPRIGWKLVSERRGTVQKAYRIQVAGPGEDFANLVWDSGRVESERSNLLAYEGPMLQPRTRYYYRVQVWDHFERESDWSAVAWWETALFSADEWQANWITPDSEAIDPQAAPVFMLCKEFTLKQPIRLARIYATAAGVYELYISGEKAGDELLAPGWTSYHKRHQYQTYDVTAQLKVGYNQIGVLLGNGWYKGQLTGFDNYTNLYGDIRACLIQLHILYEDGTEEVVVSDATWSSSTSPITLSEIYDGETYDARLEKEGWGQAGYDVGSNWSGTEIIDLPYTSLVAQENSPTRVIETIFPQSLIRTPSGETLLDMGQNMVGRIRMTLQAPAGTVIRLQHAEVLDKEGNFYTGNLRKAKQLVEYIAKGGGTESYAPHFTFQGFRYVKVEGFPGQENGLPLDAFAGEVIHSDMEPTGWFECSHPLVNQLQSNIVWGQRGNFLDLPTDCPQRDERLGWTGDAQVFIRTAAFNYHVGPFFTKWLRDLKADQGADGGVPVVVPDVITKKPVSESEAEMLSAAAWGDAAVICPWTLYLCYGDERLLADQYDSMKAWISYIRSQGDREYLWNTGFHYGDWLGLDAKENSYIGATPKDLIATAFYAHSTRLVRDAAVVLGKAEDVRAYSELLGRVIAAFREEFVTPAGRLAAPTQTAHVLALKFQLVEGNVRKRIAHDLNELVVQNEYHLTTGFVGTPYLCLVLSDNGYHETAVKLFLQESYPSWLYSITKGATTIWEHWDGIKPDGSFWSDDMNSYNHYAYGAIGDWMYRYIAGLDMDETVPGYRRICVYPRFAGSELTSAKATLLTPYGKAESAWHIEDNNILVQVVVPANSSAEVILPGAELEEVREGDRMVTASEGIHSARRSEEGVRISVGSGTYQFTYSMK